jgi:hypothetical protein
VGQQPNIQLQLENLPRPVAHPGPARRWSARRPGDLAGPGEVPWGGAFGTPGPNTGYALRLLADRPLALGAGERRAEAERLAAGLMAARASRLGRAPIPGDAEVAVMILGLRAGGPSDVSTERRRLAAHGSEAPNRLLAAVAPDLLVASLAEVERRWSVGERMIG